MRQRYINAFMIAAVVAATLACDDDGPGFTVTDKRDASQDTGEGNDVVLYDEVTACEGTDCWCLAIRDCEAVALLEVFEGGSRLISVCGHEGDRCIFRYEKEDDGAVGRYLCNVPIGREQCAFELETECRLNDLCVLGNCPVVDICGTYDIPQ